MPELAAPLPRSLLELVPASLARAYKVVPLREDGLSVEVLSADPDSTLVSEELTFALSRDVRLVGCDPTQLEELLLQYYGKVEDESGLGDEAVAGAHFTVGEKSAEADLAVLAGQAPIVAFVNQVLARAIRDRASDVHFEPFAKELKIRYRIDGTLCAAPPAATELALPVISRIKVLANLNIAERRVPQDGRIRTTLDGRAVDLRVSTLPTQLGESVVLRVLDQSAVPLDLAALGLPGDVLPGVKEAIRRPNGIFLVTGPTGSGKTTTLYGALHSINTPELKLLTIEDPVEYEIEGVMQVPINPVAGLTFASALRSFMRQDPDVVMVGEIRDLETAEIALQAALTGHLVFSTLHTNDAPSAMTRLLDMGAEPFLLAATVEAVLAQRLVRCICPSCRQEHEPPAELFAQLDLVTPGRRVSPFFRGAGCAECAHTGYRGRMGIFEWFVPTDPLRELVTERASVQLLRQKARELGMRTLRDEALRAAAAGVTTLEEVVKYT